jgi:hypothetical protein
MYTQEGSLSSWLYDFFPKTKLQNAKFLTVTFPNFEQKSYYQNVICLNGQKFDTSLAQIPCFQNVKLSNNIMFEF